jgi:hypothetical protein
MRTTKISFNLIILLLISSSAFSQLKNGFKLTLSGGGYSDESVIRFFAAATTSFDSNYDGYKLKNGGNNPNLYTEIENTTYSINSLPDSFSNMDLSLHAQVAFSGLYTLKFEEIWESDSLCSVTLIDNLLNFSQDLKAKPTYSFNAEVGSASNRFIINFKKKSLDTIAEDSTNDNVVISDSVITPSTLIISPIRVNCLGDRITIEMEEIADEVVISINDLSGKVLFLKTLVPQTKSLELVAPTNGFQLIKVSADQNKYFGKIYSQNL